MNFSQIVKDAYSKEIRFKKSEVEDNLRQREELAKHGIIARFDDNDVVFSHYTRCEKREEIECSHEYVLPSFADEVMSLLKCATDFSVKSINIGFIGAKGSGKSEFVREVCAKAGFAHVYQVNGRDDMDSSDFHGEKTVIIDKESQQNFIVFNKLPLRSSFITELIHHSAVITPAGFRFKLSSATEMI